MHRLLPSFVEHPETGTERVKDLDRQLTFLPYCSSRFLRFRFFIWFLRWFLPTQVEYVDYEPMCGFTTDPTRVQEVETERERRMEKQTAWNERGGGR